MTKTLFAAAVLISSAASAAAIARKAEVVAILEVRSRLTGTGRDSIDAAELSDRIREAARRALPDARVQGCGAACDLKAARELGADRAVTGELLRADNGFLVSLALYQTADGKLLSSASAIGSTPEELGEAVIGAAVELFRAHEDLVVLAMGPDGRPDAPQAPAPLPQAGPLDLDANLLAAFDSARSADARGRDKPYEAAAAWREVAELGGRNPFREMAALRADQWENFAETKRAYDAQLAADNGRLGKLLPSATASDATKLDALVNFSRIYGVEKATPMLGLIAAPALRARAEMALGCEARDASKCLLMAHAADEAKNSKAALEYLDDACAAGAAEACAEAGERWLQPGTRDAARGIAALQRGCAAAGAQACARLARVYEEGDGTAANAVLAAEMRERACAVGDGKSCRQRACSADSDSRAIELWQLGCSRGDAASCALAQLAAPQKQSPETAAKPGSTPAKQPAPLAATAQPDRSRHRFAATLIGVGLVAAAGAAFIAAQDSVRDQDAWRYRRPFLSQAHGDSPRGGLALALGAAALVTGGAGVAVLLTKPEAAKLNVGVAPGAVTLSGTFP